MRSCLYILNNILHQAQDLELDNDSDHKLGVQLEHLRNRFNITLQERDDLEAERDQYRQAFEHADTERSQLREELHHWEQAATAASALKKLLHPYSS